MVQATQVTVRVKQYRADLFRNVENEYEMHGGITVVYDESVHEVRRVQDVSELYFL